jgi:hypothetical protein
MGDVDTHHMRAVRMKYKVLGEGKVGSERLSVEVLQQQRQSTIAHFSRHLIKL